MSMLSGSPFHTLSMMANIWSGYLLAKRPLVGRLSKSAHVRSCLDMNSALISFRTCPWMGLRNWSGSGSRSGFLARHSSSLVSSRMCMTYASSYAMRSTSSVCVCPFAPALAIASAASLPIDGSCLSPVCEATWRRVVVAPSALRAFMASVIDRRYGLSLHLRSGSLPDRARNEFIACMEPRLSVCMITLTEVGTIRSALLIPAISAA